MIKIIIYFDIAFFYRKANILHRWSKILHKFYGNKGVCYSCRSHWLGWKLSLLYIKFTRPLSSCYIKISVASQCRILVAVQYLNRQLLAFFLQLTTCTCWTALWLGHCWRRLTQTELADWQQMHESGSTNTNLRLTQTAATPYKCSTLPTNSTLLAAPDVPTMGEQLHPQQPSHDGTMSKKCQLQDFKKQPNQNSIDILNA